MTEQGMRVDALSEKTFSKFRKLIFETTNINMREGKQILVSNRLRKRILALQLSSYEEYYRYLTESEEGLYELPHFIDAVSTNETYFYRETNHLTALRRTILPELFERKKRIVIWSAGCSTGEEPYTLRLTLESGRGKLWNGEAEILATDVSGEVVERARVGRYHGRSIRFVPPEILDRYFSKCDVDTYRIADELRNGVTFRVHNLLKEKPPLRRADIIFCRNVMIYFDKETQRRLTDEYFAEVLDPRGYLCIGHSESLSGTSRRFRFQRGMGAPVYRLTDPSGGER